MTDQDLYETIAEYGARTLLSALPEPSASVARIAFDAAIAAMRAVADAEGDTRIAAAEAAIDQAVADLVVKLNAGA